MRNFILPLLMIYAMNSFSLAVVPPRRAETSMPATAAAPASHTIFLPIVTRPNPPHEVLYCSFPNAAIPDGSTLSDTIHIPDQEVVLNAEIWVKADHSFVGDLIITLDHGPTGRSLTLLDRPGLPASSTGCSYNNIYAIFSDRVSQPAENKCNSSTLAISGMYLPIDSLDSLHGAPSAGDWTLRVADLSSYDSGVLSGWCIRADLASFAPGLAEDPPLPAIPDAAVISGISGRGQALPLDCESRSAVDWAAYFGISIDELTFFNQLPTSDNPEKGFVGDVNGYWGQVPPNDYGIHAEPVAALLRDYGLNAYAGSGFRWDDLRAEIAAGRPAIVWVEGYIRAGKPRFYISPSDGAVSTVAPFEHTVIVVGYSTTHVSILNGSKITSYPLNSFLDAWATLGNMAIIRR